jgi:hypothetical protein
MEESLQPEAPRFDETVAAFIDAAAALQGLTIAPDWREGVATHFKVTAAAAALVLSHPLPDELDAAPVFGA